MFTHCSDQKHGRSNASWLSVITLVALHTSVTFAQVGSHEGSQSRSTAQGAVESLGDALERDALLRARGESAPFAPDRSAVLAEWRTPTRPPWSPVPKHQTVINSFGLSNMRIGFKKPVVVDRIAVGNNAGPGPTPVVFVVIGNRAGTEVARSVPLQNMRRASVAISFPPVEVDELMFVANSPGSSGAWYRLDHLSYHLSGQQPSLTRVVDFDVLPSGIALSSVDDEIIDWTQPRDSRPEFEKAPEVEKRNDAPVQQRIGKYSRAIGDAQLVTSFQGIGKSPGLASPPDTCGAAGPYHFAELLNGQFAVFDKTTGRKLVQISSQAFFGLPGFDPRIYFDVLSERWVAIMSHSMLADGRLLLAVSQTVDPMGSWFKASFSAPLAYEGCWIDFPILGIDEDGVYIVGSALNYAGCPAEGQHLFVLPMETLLASPPHVQVRDIALPQNQQPYYPTLAMEPGHRSYVIQPAFVESPRRLAAVNVNIVDDVSDPAINFVGSISVPEWSVEQVLLTTSNGVSIGTTASFFQNVVWQNGSLYTCYHTNPNLSGTQIAWLELNPSSLVVVENGTIRDPTLQAAFSSVGVNSRGDMLFGFSAGSAVADIGAYWAARDHGASPNISGYSALHVGEGDYSCGQSTCRWGDYSFTTMDPLDKESIWTVQEYAVGPGSTPFRWGTWIGRVSFGDCNHNNIEDSEEISSGSAFDCNSNGIPDGCDRDCNSNGFADDCDILALASWDCNSNGVPDECDIDQRLRTDCDANRVPDDCQDVLDCDSDGVADLCQIHDNPAGDCDTDGILDKCQDDCNSNGRRDCCDIAGGTSSDCNGNGIPDECDVGAGKLQWASDLLAFSSEFDLGVPDWRAVQVLAAPNVPTYAMSPMAWATATADGGEEFVVVEFVSSVYATGATVVESFNGGFVTQVDAVDENEGFYTVWEGADAGTIGVISTVEFTWPKTNYLVHGLKVVIDANHVLGGWEQIDAIGLRGTPSPSIDCNTNGVPDECELVAADCNTNGKLDICELSSNGSLDANTNGWLDVCEPICLDQDADCSGTVDGSDILLVRSPGTFDHPAAFAVHPRGDVNRSGHVDGSDIISIRAPGVWNTSTGACFCPQYPYGISCAYGQNCP